MAGEPETPNPLMAARLRALEARRAQDVAEAASGPEGPSEESILEGFRATMGGAPLEASVRPPATQVPVEAPVRAPGGRPGFRVPPWAAAAALLLGAGATWFAYDLGQRSSGTEGPSGPIRMGDETRSGKGAKVLSWSPGKVSLDLGAGDLSTGWYEAELRLEAGGQVAARTAAWHASARWDVDLPPDAHNARIVRIHVRRVSDDGTHEGYIIEEWSNELPLDDMTRE